MNAPLHNRLREADSFLRQRKPHAAENICAAILLEQPDHIEALLILARAKQMQNDWSAMLARIDEVLKAHPGHKAAQLMRAEALSGLGQIGETRRHLEKIKSGAGDDADLLGRIAEIQTQLGDHEDARATLRQAYAIAPDNRAILYNLASEEIAGGAMDRAEELLNRLIAIAPDDHDAYYNRATVRRQTAENNHVAEIKHQLDGLLDNPLGEIQLCYALAKELEDLGEYDQSFEYLSRGASVRRKHMAYRVEDDIATMETIADVFDHSFFENMGAQTEQQNDGQGAIFILGLPRSGTTLVDRILSSHPEVESIGEVNDLAMAIMQLASGATSKEELVAKSSEIDGGRLAAAYCRSTRERSRGCAHIIDKTPLNFLYIGLIAKAMPRAKIIHLVRDPMDVGFAMYKTLFRMGYPFSYDLHDIGRYMKAKDKLMAHWDTVLPGRIIHLRYEELVADQEEQTRALVSALDLEWNDACLSFHTNKTPSATASAAQVRQPIYSSSVGKWRSYEPHLAALREALEI